MGLIALIIIGAAAGYIATRMMGVDMSIPATIAVGVLGAFAGMGIIRFLLTISSWLGGFVGAILGAVLLIWLWQRFGPKA